MGPALIYNVGMDWDGDKQYLLIGDGDYFPLLYRWKNENPRLDIKFMRREEAVNKLCFSYGPGALPALLKMGIGYGKAKQWLRLLQAGEIAKNEKAQKVYSALEKGGHLISDPFAKLGFANKQILLFEMEEDVEMENLLKREGLSFHHLGFPELGIKKKLDIDNPPPLSVYQNKFELYMSLFAHLRGKLLSGGNPDEICLHVNGESDPSYLETLSSLFGLKVSLSVSLALSSDPALSPVLDDIHSQRDFSILSEESDSPAIKKLAELVSRYELNELSDFDFAYSCLSEIIESTPGSQRESDEGLSCFSDFSFKPGKMVYVTDFQHGSFYREYDDDAPLRDYELERMGLNPSYRKSQLERRKKRNFLLYQDIAWLSRPLERLSEKLYPSQFVEEFDWGAKVIKRHPESSDGVFTKQAYSLFAADSLDRRFAFNSRPGYRDYDHSFKGVVDPSLFSKKTHWGVTQLESYFLCPYKFYMNILIPPLEDDLHAAWRGNFGHRLFEGIFHGDYDFEKAYQKAKEGYLEDIKRAQEGGGAVSFDGYEKLLLDLYHEYFHKLIGKAREWLTSGNLSYLGDLIEKPVDYLLDDGEGIRGRIDKILLSGKGDDAYFTIIDYKSGATSFDMDSLYLGLTLQLPLYAKAITDEEGYLKKELAGDRPYRFGGFGISHIYQKNPTDFVGSPSLAEKALRPKGIYLHDLNYAYSLDKSWLKEKGDGISSRGGEYYAGGIPFGDGQPSFFEGVDDFGVEEMFSLSEVVAKDIIKRIRSLQFPIAPLDKKDPERKKEHRDLPCSYCPYGDICYKNKARDQAGYSKRKEEMLSRYSGGEE